MEVRDNAEKTLRRWRWTFIAIYLVFTSVAVLWPGASIVAFHCGLQQQAAQLDGPRISFNASDPRELRNCQQKLEQLLTDLHRETFTLQARALRFEENPAAEWRNWSRAWRQRWRVLGRRCRLGELAGSGVSPAIDRMADIHKHLRQLQISYTGVMDQFVERYAERLNRLKQQLAKVRSMIDRQRPHRPHTRASASGAKQ